MVAFSTIIWIPHGLSLWKCDDFHISDGCFEGSDGVGKGGSASNWVHLSIGTGQDRWMCVDRVKYTSNLRHKWMRMCLYSFMMLKMWAKYILEMSSTILVQHLGAEVMRPTEGATESSSITGEWNCQMPTSLKPPSNLMPGSNVKK